MELQILKTLLQLHSKQWVTERNFETDREEKEGEERKQNKRGKKN